MSWRYWNHTSSLLRCSRIILYDTGVRTTSWPALGPQPLLIHEENHLCLRAAPVMPVVGWAGSCLVRGKVVVCLCSPLGHDACSVF